MVLGHFQGTGRQRLLSKEVSSPASNRTVRTILVCLEALGKKIFFKALMLFKNNLETTVSYVKMDFSCREFQGLGITGHF